MSCHPAIALLLTVWPAAADDYRLEFAGGDLVMERVGYSAAGVETAWTTPAGEAVTAEDAARLVAVEAQPPSRIRVTVEVRWEGDLAVTVPLKVDTPTRPDGPNRAWSNVTPRTKRGRIGTALPQAGQDLVVSANGPVGRWQPLHAFNGQTPQPEAVEFPDGGSVDFLGRFFDDAGRPTFVFVHSYTDREVRVLGTDVDGQPLTPDTETSTRDRYVSAVVRFDVRAADRVKEVRLETRPLRSKSFPPIEVPAFGE